MTRDELVICLRDTAEAMDSAADWLYFYGGVSAKAMQHAADLAGAAKMVIEWADELEKEGA